MGSTTKGKCLSEAFLGPPLGVLAPAKASWHHLAKPTMFLPLLMFVHQARSLATCHIFLSPAIEAADSPSLSSAVTCVWRKCCCSLTTTYTCRKSPALPTPPIQHHAGVFLLSCLPQAQEKLCSISKCHLIFSCLQSSLDHWQPCQQFQDKSGSSLTSGSSA